MNITSASSVLLGGLGLFLVGMWLMTDGLKLAAGESLREILNTWTNTKRRGLITGFFITALVQSSSAVTVATIGFANAGLLTLTSAVWVIFGSNVGTTMTGWLVALIGFKINIDAFALPMIGIGMLIRLTGKKSKRAAIGQAILGFGLFFLGISVLKEAFESLGAGIHLPSLQEAGITSLLLYILLGIVLTTLMQSSSAAIVITLSAAEGGLIPLGAAAATVIGANLGTTTTAMLSVWGATATAKRVAASHVLFNLITAVVAVVLLVPMLAITNWVQTFFNLTADAATTLAIFHTIFNILGVLLMWPLADRLVKVLSVRFISEEEMAGRPEFLDQTALEVPTLASVALMREVNNLNKKTISIAMDAISTEGGNEDRFSVDQANLEQLASAIGKYIAQLSKTDLPENIAHLLPEIILIVQQYIMVADFACEVVSLQKDIDIKQEHGEILNAIIKLKEDAALILQSAIINNPGFSLDNMQQDYKKIEDDYDDLRLAILQAGADGRLGMVTVDDQLHQANTIKRITKYIIKAINKHAQLISNLNIDPLSLVMRQSA